MCPVFLRFWTNICCKCADSSFPCLNRLHEGDAALLPSNWNQCWSVSPGAIHHANALRSLNLLVRRNHKRSTTPRSVPQRLYRPVQTSRSRRLAIRQPTKPRELHHTVTTSKALAETIVLWRCSRTSISSFLPERPHSSIFLLASFHSVTATSQLRRASSHSVHVPDARLASVANSTRLFFVLEFHMFGPRFFRALQRLLHRRFEAIVLARNAPCSLTVSSANDCPSFLAGKVNFTLGSSAEDRAEVCQVFMSCLLLSHARH